MRRQKETAPDLAHDVPTARVAPSPGTSAQNTEEFIESVAHDLVQPLRVAQGYLELLANGGPERSVADMKALAVRALAATGRITEIIDDLRAYALAHDGPLTTVRLDPAAIARQAIGDVRRLVEESGATVHIDPLPLVRGDAGGLVRVFQNLFTNAMKFRGPEPPRIVVTGRVEGKDVVIDVRDNGMGIDPDSQSRIFEAFERGPGATHPGLGIGLAIVKRIMERSGGMVSVESTPGEGSAFHLRLPLAELEVEPTNAPLLEPKATYRFVIIDDYPDIRELYALALEQAGGFTMVGVASDGAEGIDVVRSTQPDLVLLDLSMPTFDGLEAIGGVRRACPTAHVVVLSGFKREKFQNITREIGASDYIEKGISPVRLPDRLRRVLAQPPPPPVDLSPDFRARYSELI